MVDALTEIADRLYAIPPERFVAERAAAVAEARASGDQDTAAALAKLRRPTLAAWLVNLLALRRPDLVADLVELAGALRAAQRDLRGDQLRELSTQRRAAVSALVAAARELAVNAEPGLAPAKLPLGEVETTLGAALADEEVARLVRSGRLVRAVAYDGFGEVPRPQLRLIVGGDAIAGGPGGAAGGAGPGGGQEASRAVAAAQREWLRAAARQELADARSAAHAAEAARERAAAAQRERELALAEVDAALAELAARRAALVEEVAEVTTAHQEARRAVVAARRRMGNAEAAVTDLDSTG